VNFLRVFISKNIQISQWFDKTFMPSLYLLDGNDDFIRNFAPSHFKENMKVYDVGGGKRPFISIKFKSDLKLTVVGLDISDVELNCAPHGAYDLTVCADIANIRGHADGDLVICQAVLEHVENTEAAIESIASLLRPGGKALIFVPCRNAIFARLNILLPEKFKRQMLFSIFPNTRSAQGFQSFYHKCTPNELIGLANYNNMDVLESKYYFTSTYFSFFFPIHFVWRIWIILFKFFRSQQAAETFSLVLSKRIQ
jgi:2-polyprenyl-3-methyl-5-hydroxy-6-metoxy-1,4-benzoquinol methylase